MCHYELRHTELESFACDLCTSETGDQGVSFLTQVTRNRHWESAHYQVRVIKPTYYPISKLGAMFYFKSFFVSSAPSVIIVRTRRRCSWCTSPKPTPRSTTVSTVRSRRKLRIKWIYMWSLLILVRAKSPSHPRVRRDQPLSIRSFPAGSATTRRASSSICMHI